MAGEGEGGNAGQRDALADATAQPSAPTPASTTPVPGKETQIDRLLAGNGGSASKVGHQSLIQKEYGTGGAPRRTPGTVDDAAALLGVSLASPPATTAAPHHAKHGHGTHAHASKPAADAINSDDGQNATRNDLLTVDPPAIHFGRVPFRAGRGDQTEAAPYVVTVYNPTGDTITLDDIHADAGADFPIFSAESTETVIPPGGSLRFRVGFRPHHVGAHSSTVQLIQGGVSIGRVHVEGTALDERDHWESLAVSPQAVNFRGVAIGEESPPHKLKVTNASGVPVRLEDLAPMAGDVDQFRLYGASNDEIPAGAATELSIAFRPTLLHAQEATFRIRTAGDEATGKDLDLRHGKVTARGVGLDAADARHDAVLDGRDVGPLDTFDEMLASLQAAQQFTEAGAGHDEGHSREDYDRAEKLVAPVAARLDQLAEKLPEFANTMGFSSTATREDFGYAHDYVRIWAGLLRPDKDGHSPTINPDPYVLAFAHAKEVIQVLTGEEKDAPTLRALGRAAKWTPLEITGAAVAGGVVAWGGAELVGLGEAAPSFSSPSLVSLRLMIANEWQLASGAFGTAATWVMSNPDEANELGTWLGSIGVSIIDAGGVKEFFEQIQDVESFINVFGQMYEPVHNHQQAMNARRAAGEPMDIEPTTFSPGPRAPATEDEPTAEPTSPRRGTPAADTEDAEPTPNRPRGTADAGDAGAEPGGEPPQVVRLKNQVMARVRTLIDHVQRIAARARGAGGPIVDDGAPLPSRRTPRQYRERAAEVRGQVEQALATAGAPAGSYRVEVLDEHAFAKRFGAARGTAVMLIEDDRPTVYAQPATTAEDLAHEATHLAQLRDASNPRVQENIRILSDATLDPTTWRKADAGLRKELYERKLEVEIDAKTRELATAEGEARAELETDLAALQQRHADVQAISDEQLLKMKAHAAPLPEFLDDPSFLFAKQRHTVAGEKLSPYHFEEKADTKRTPLPEHPAAKNGSKVAQVGDTWTEAIVITSSYKGRVTVERQPTATLVYVDEPSGTRRRYVTEAGAKLAVSTGDEVEPGTPLAHERSKNYRLVDVDGEMRVEEQTRKRWQLAGEHARMRGLVTEDAARAQVDAELASEMQKPPDQRRGQLAGYARLDNQTGSGAGFDDVVVEFHGDPPSAVIRIVETKDYPNRSVPLNDMTAIRDNLVTNRDRLRAQIATALETETPETRTPEFRDMSDAQLRATSKALNEDNVQVELRLGPTTRVSQSTLDKLRTELAAAFHGKDVLAPSPIAVSQDFIDEAAAKRFPSPNEEQQQ